MTLCPQMASSPATLEPRAPQPTTATTTIAFPFFFLSVIQLPIWLPPQPLFLVVSTIFQFHYLSVDYPTTVISPPFSRTLLSFNPLPCDAAVEIYVTIPALWSCCQHWTLPQYQLLVPTTSALLGFPSHAREPPLRQKQKTELFTKLVILTWICMDRVWTNLNTLLSS